jgi:DNA-binding SARP family transcriptional activator
MALAAGVIEALRRRRRRRTHRSPDAAVAPGQASPLYQQLAAEAGGDAPDRLRYALEQLGSAVVASRLACRPRIVQQGEDHLDVLLDQPAPRPPDGWEATAEGRIWTRTADGLAADRCGSRRPDILDPTPLLVAIGEPDEDGQLYLDLESAPVVALAGDRDTAIGVARGFVVELAHSLMAESARILVIGDLGSSVVRLDRVSVFDTWVEANREIQAHAESSRDAMAAAGWPNGFIGRSSGMWADVLMPLVVVAAGPPLETAALENLLTGDPATAAAVVIGESLDGALRIDCETNQLTIAQLGLTCRPRPLSTDFVDEVVDLLDDAAGGTEDEEPAAALAESTHDDNDWLGAIDAPAPDTVEADEGMPPDDAGRPYEDPPSDVLVRVLGDIEVDGTKAPATPKQTALITYIALHGSTDGERLTEALWCSPAGVGSHRKRLTNTLGECRRILDGDHLPPAVDGRYSVGPGVLSDIELWDLRVKAAATQPLDLAAGTLQGAIDLVRGPIFSYRTADRDSYAWVDIENWMAIWEKKVTSVAQHLAELYMDLGQVDQAIAVATHILQAVQTDTAMTETLMRAHAANGDLRSLQRVYQAHVNALEHLDLDAPAESTTTLLDHLRSSAPN